MKYFLDAEFMEDGRLIMPVSIAIVCEDGQHYYAEFADADLSQANEWVKEHVIPQLGAVRPRTTDQIRQNILDFVGDKGSRFSNDRPEFWGYYCAYDWVLLCQLFGSMTDLPKGWPMYCKDIKQYCDDLGNPKLPKQPEDQHNALADARWNEEAYKFLRAHHLGMLYMDKTIHRKD